MYDCHVLWLKVVESNQHLLQRGCQEILKPVKMKIIVIVLNYLCKDVDKIKY